METNITVAGGTPSNAAQTQKKSKAKDVSDPSMQELDSLLRDTRTDTYESRAKKIDPTIMGLTQSQMHDLTSLTVLRHLKHSPKLRNAPSSVRNLFKSPPRPAALKTGATQALSWMKGNKVRVGAGVLEAVNFAAILDKHTTRFMYDAPDNEKVLTAYNHSFLHDTSSDEEFVDILRHEGDYQDKDGNIQEGVKIAQAVVYEFGEDGTILRRDGDYILEGDQSITDIKKQSRQKAMLVPTEEVVTVDINDEMEYLTNDFKTMANAVGNFTEEQLDSSSVKTQLGKLGERINAKLNLLTRFIKHQGESRDPVKADELISSLNLLKKEAETIPGLDTGEIDSIIDGLVEPSELGDMETATGETQESSEDVEATITMKNPESLSDSEKAELKDLISKLETKFKPTQKFLTQLKKNNNPSAHAFAPDGLLTDDNYDRVVGMINGDINKSEIVPDDANGEDIDLSLSDEEKKQFEKFLESEPEVSLNLPKILEALKKIDTPTAVTVKPSETQEAPSAQSISTTGTSANIDELNSQLSNIRRYIMKNPDAREEEFGQLGIWLYENKDSSEELLSKIANSGTSELAYIKSNLPDPLKLGRAQKETKILNLETAVENLNQLFKSANNIEIKFHIESILERSGN